MNNKNDIHIPVLLAESINSLNIIPEGIYIDGTFGCGNHSRLILSKLNRKGILIAIDKDLMSIKIAKKIKDKRFHIIHGKFSLIEDYAKKYNIVGKINGILLDLGISTLQIKDKKRGFSFLSNSILDMRMDITHGKSAMKWLANSNKKEITSVLKNFGEEHFAKRIANSIVNQNYIKNIICTKELKNLITKNIPFFDKKNPATRSFQAIRIYINNELNEIKELLNSTLKVLAPKGRFSIISFHSLEDKIIKNFINQHSNKININYKLNTKKLINKRYEKNIRINLLGKIKPSLEEINSNPHSKSALLRFAEKIII